MHTKSSRRPARGNRTTGLQVAGGKDLPGPDRSCLPEIPTTPRLLTLRAAQSAESTGRALAEAGAFLLYEAAHGRQIALLGSAQIGAEVRNGHRRIRSGRVRRLERGAPGEHALRQVIRRGVGRVEGSGANRFGNGGVA